MTRTRHILTLLIPAWGHTVSYLHLCVQMLRSEPELVITLFVHNMVVPKMHAELKECIYDRERLRIVGTGDEGVEFSPQAVAAAFGQLMGGWVESLAGLMEGTEAWPRPRAVHMDVSCGFVIDPTKTIVGDGASCKILLWSPISLSSMPGILFEHDFVAIAQEIYDDEGRRRGRTLEEILDAVTYASNGIDAHDGRIVSIPGVYSIYDYEQLAYAAGRSEGLAQVLSTGQKFAKVCDGYVVPTSTAIEPGALKFCREVARGRGQELFAVGLQTDERSWDPQGHLTPANEVIRAFLDEAEKKYGPKSVLYISFGSLFFPTATPELVQALLDTFLSLEQPFPFLFALGGKLASLPKELVDRIHASGRGLACDFWVEQRAIIQHGAVGWFLTHGGWNSITESMARGLPLIIWPAGAEQPINAAVLAADPNPVAIELFQVRTGPQRGPSLRSPANITGTVEDATEEFKRVLHDVRGERGAFVSENARKMAGALGEVRAGEVKEDIAKLIAF
ncbi:hypothetical protein FB45DRAFT_1007545 [Roridomyces roridus]|uniref:Glycosyltransferase n=1 Tax=Roridomyces roridus TaxID=1738132 RepID=A0AAD7BDU1_9AGAR|nr:hypothetical protein FB45DRAFT_1007545 [Roridomyces roridus]